eukprot:TRINITY_DN773120_c0_g1_i1.p1 TRINITY_DN773120_c0_g1~~TRINITY_DN773120_c0_g1_i1.p1  ORF type:complete len:130 (+),score=11.66 TRINITY_DN773120_c0_g1_i1:342-731(+)
MMPKKPHSTCVWNFAIDMNHKLHTRIPTDDYAVIYSSSFSASSFVKNLNIFTNHKVKAKANKTEEIGMTPDPSLKEVLTSPLKLLAGSSVSSSSKMAGRAKQNQTMAAKRTLKVDPCWSFKKSINFMTE